MTTGGDYWVTGDTNPLLGPGNEAELRVSDEQHDLGGEDVSWSLYKMLQVLQLNVFERRPLAELFTTSSPPDRSSPQMPLAWR